MMKRSGSEEPGALLILPLSSFYPHTTHMRSGYNTFIFLTSVWGPECMKLTQAVHSIFPVRDATYAGDPDVQITCTVYHF